MSVASSSPLDWLSLWLQSVFAVACSALLFLMETTLKPILQGVLELNDM